MHKVKYEYPTPSVVIPLRKTSLIAGLIFWGFIAIIISACNSSQLQVTQPIRAPKETTTIVPAFAPSPTSMAGISITPTMIQPNPTATILAPTISPSETPTPVGDFEVCSVNQQAPNRLILGVATHLDQDYIFIVDMNGQNFRWLTQGTSPSWSPKGDFFVYKKVDPNKKIALMGMNPDNSTPVRLISGYESIYSYAWDSKGENIIFSGIDSTNKEVLQKMNRDGSAQVMIAEGFRWIDSYAWSNDSQSVFFTGFKPPANQSLYRFDFNSKNLYIIYDPGLAMAINSVELFPDGKHLIVSITVLKPATGVDMFYVINADGSNSKPLDALGLPFIPNYRKLNPSGKYLVFVGRVDGIDKIISQFVETDTSTIIDPGGSEPFVLDWSPNGAMFDYSVKNDNETRGLYVANLDGSIIKPILTQKRGSTVWNSDSRHITFVLETSDKIGQLSIIDICTLQTRKIFEGVNLHQINLQP